MLKLIYSVLALIPMSLFSQYYLKPNELLKKLNEKNGPIPLVKGFENREIVKIENKQLGVFPQYIVKHKDSLLVLVERTGLVFKLRVSPDKISYTRIDSTHYYGYNGNAIIFSAHDTLFSFGGNGFWRKNGQLRYFNEKYAEWDLISLDQEVPAQNNLFFYHPAASELFYVLLPYTDEAIGNRHEDFECYKLDLHAKKNILLGTLNDHFRKLFSETPNPTFLYVPALNGVIVSFKSKEHYLFSFEMNTAFKLKNQKLDFFYGSSANIYPTTLFAVNDTIFFTNSNDQSFQLKYQLISRDDFEKDGLEIFHKPYHWKWIVIPSLVVLIFILIMVFYKIIKWHISKEISKQTNSLNHEDELLNPLAFTESEIDLIKKMITTSRKNDFFNVDDFNSELGLRRKALEVQKRIRTEVINRINHKFKVNHQKEVDLIGRIRSEEDRRYYKYFISEEHWKYFTK